MYSDDKKPALISISPGLVHCDHCNSEIDPDYVIGRSWRGERAPSCPNCGTILPVRALAEATKLVCPKCAAESPVWDGDPKAGDLRRVRFCPECGASLLSRAKRLIPTR